MLGIGEVFNSAFARWAECCLVIHYFLSCFWASHYFLYLSIMICLNIRTEYSLARMACLKRIFFLQKFHTLGSLFLTLKKLYISFHSLSIIGTWRISKVFITVIPYFWKRICTNISLFCNNPSILSSVGFGVFWERIFTNIWIRCWAQSFIQHCWLKNFLVTSLSFGKTFCNSATFSWFVIGIPLINGLGDRKVSFPKNSSRSSSWVYASTFCKNLAFLILPTFCDCTISFGCSMRRRDTEESKSWFCGHEISLGFVFFPEIFHFYVCYSIL